MISVLLTDDQGYSQSGAESRVKGEKHDKEVNGSNDRCRHLNSWHPGDGRGEPV